MDNLITLIKKKMIEKGRDDFTIYLSEILDCSKQWASAKLNCKASFTDVEISKLNEELNFDSAELKEALGVK